MESEPRRKIGDRVMNVWFGVAGLLCCPIALLVVAIVDKRTALKVMVLGLVLLIVPLVVGAVFGGLREAVAGRLSARDIGSLLWRLPFVAAVIWFLWKSLSG